MSSAGRPTRLHVHVAELRLPGVSRTQAQRIGSTATQELTRLLQQSPLPPSLTQTGGIARIQAGQLGADPATRPENLGRDLARLIAQALTRHTGGGS